MLSLGRSRDPHSELNMQILEMSHGNPGALTTLGKIYELLGAVQMEKLVPQMQEMNLIGANIWIGFKYASEFDVKQLVQRIQQNDPKLVEAINRFADPSAPVKLRVQRPGEGGIPHR